MKNLPQALQITEEEYENIVFQNWLNWCGRQEASQRDLQAILANSLLFNWWKKTYETYEQDFMIEIYPYQGNISKRDAYLLYVKNVYKIQKYFSKPLLDLAKKTKINPTKLKNE